MPPQKMMYTHTQTDWFILIPCGIGIVLTGYLGILYSNWHALSVPVILLIGVILFPNLTVSVNDESIEIRFGWGLIRKKFKLEKVESCTVVRNRWWYGRGIRWIPQGWLFNVSGLNAVELSMKNGRVYRIGTDEPQKLNEAIQKKGNNKKGGRPANTRFAT